MFVAEAFTGQPGSFVPVSETLQAFKAITDGEYDNVPEQAFFMCGGLEDLERNADKLDRKSTRLNSSHANISYAVFCLKKKKYNTYSTYLPSIFLHLSPLVA